LAVALSQSRWYFLPTNDQAFFEPDNEKEKAMHYEVSEAEITDAKHPHEIFLINLITNHVLIFVGLLGMAKTYPWVMLITPSISIVVLSYLMIRSRSKLKSGSWYAACHWQLCAHRSKLFIGMLLVLALVIAGLLLSVGGDASQLKPGHYALGGVSALPTLVFILVLIVMESDALHKARTGVVPQWLIDKYPNADMRRIAE
jgi:membrane-associated HD superfamily phosphohydrolase